jgi:phosphatidylethanolamine/phosphatidyl-N-methylethanolamine N-methyltransferase
MPSDLSLFGRRLLRNPRQISAVTPSSRALAAAMTSGLRPGAGPVIEFGPGTGRVTQAILNRGVAPADLALFEMDAEFVHHLGATFPGVQVHHAPAQEAPARHPGGAQAVISGLPLLSMPPALRAAILRAALAVMAPEAAFVQFTYGARPPLPPDLLAGEGLVAEAGPTVWTNLPPARVYRFRRA